MVESMTSDARIRGIVLSELNKLAPEADLTLLDPQDDFREALDIDSFDALQMLIALDEQLGVEIPEEDYARLETVDALVSYLAERI